jgi:hypothetical protein
MQRYSPNLIVSFEFSCSFTVAEARSHWQVLYSEWYKSKPSELNIHLTPPSSWSAFDELL